MEQREHGFLHMLQAMDRELNNAFEMMADLLYLIRMSLDCSAKLATYVTLADETMKRIRVRLHTDPPILSLH
jgi:hypothetical protein